MSGGKIPTNEQLVQKLNANKEQIKILRGRVDKYLKEMKKLKKEFTRSLNNSAGISGDDLRRIQLLESELDAVENTINYFISDESGTTGHEEEENEKTETEERRKENEKIQEQNRLTKISGYEFQDKVVGNKICTEKS